MNLAIIIPAAGRGTRFGSPLPKQYHVLGGLPILARTLATALRVPHVIAVVVAVASDDAQFEDMLQGAGLADTRLHRVDGGEERQFSIRNALAHPAVADADIVLVHDAVRPLASVALYERVSAATLTHDAVVPVTRISDTVKRVDEGGFVVKTLPRADLRSVQTPQGFKADLLRKAYEQADAEGWTGTDDASLVEAAGGRVSTIEGETWNMKVTTGSDVSIAELLLHEAE